MSKLVEDYIVDQRGYCPHYVEERDGGWRTVKDGIYGTGVYVTVQEVMEWMYEKKVLGDAP